jgi:formyl-CoA transferase
MVRTIAGTQLVGSPIRVDAERQDSALPPPALGEHTIELLSALGLDADMIAQLKAKGVAA